MNIKSQTSMNYGIFEYLNQETYKVCEKEFLQELIAFSLIKFQDILNFLLNRKLEPDWPVVLFEKESPQ
jgi:hypothetical protein